MCSNLCRCEHELSVKGNNTEWGKWKKDIREGYLVFRRDERTTQYKKFPLMDLIIFTLRVFLK
jgi:hypothetical protein